MKRITAILIVVIMMLTFAVGCSLKNYPIVGTWVYTDEASGITLTYEFRNNGKCT